MAVTTSEQAVAALQAWFADKLASTFPTQGGRLQFWDQTAEQPALFVRQDDEDDEWQGVGLQVTTVHCALWIYARIGADDVPRTVLNSLKAAIEAAMAPDSRTTGWFTLGGIVAWARIRGKTEFFPGDTGNQAVMTIPVEILLP